MINDWYHENNIKVGDILSLKPHYYGLSLWLVVQLDDTIMSARLIYDDNPDAFNEYGYMDYLVKRPTENFTTWRWEKFW